MIRTFCAAAGAAHKAIPTTISTHPRIACVLVIVNSTLLRCLPKNPCLQDLPFGVVLRAPVLSTVVIEVAAGFFGERVDEQPALHAAGDDDPADGVEIPAAVLVAPRRASRSKRPQPQWCSRCMTCYAPRMPGTPGHEDRLHAVPEELVVEGRGGTWW